MIKYQTLLLHRPNGLFVGVALLLMLMGCESKTPVVAPTQEAQRTASAQEDALQSPLSPTAPPAVAPGDLNPTAVQEDALESPLLPTVPPAVAPSDLKPAPGTGIVHGLLVLDGMPEPGRTLYLAPLIASGEQMELASLDEQSDDRTETNASGIFVFQDVAPGRYALGIGTPFAPILLQGEDGSDIVIEVVAGGIVDQGVVKSVPF